MTPRYEVQIRTHHPLYKGRVYKVSKHASLKAAGRRIGSFLSGSRSLAFQAYAPADIVAVDRVTGEEYPRKACH